MSSPEQSATSLEWVRTGTDLLREGITSLGGQDAAWDAPTSLPGWTRKHLVAHVAGNAEALVNLTTWARTGVETPMYASPQQRQQDIDRGATLSPEELVAWFEESAAALEEGWSALGEDSWAAQVRTAQGRTVPATETPWMRSREVLLHAVDLGTGVGVEDLPAGFLSALVADTVTKRSGQETPALHLVSTDTQETWDVPGEGAPVQVEGPLAQLAAWMSGRQTEGLHATTDGTEGGLPTLPPWL